MNAPFFRNGWALALLAGPGLLALTAARPRPPEENILQRIARQVSEYYAAVLPEKAYLHLDKPVYATGETIWFSAYVVDALRHQADSTSRVLYVDLVSPEQKIVSRRTLRLQGGRAAGDIDVTDTLAAGVYQLRAYTTWMRNAGDNFIYSRRLQVWPASPYTAEAVPPMASAARKAGAPAPAAAPGGRPDVQFFPEGGSLVEGLPAVVACKAVAPGGRGVDVRGQILDERNAVVVAAFATAHLGMGRFAFVPAAGHQYHAHLTLPGGGAADYPLPAPQASGYVLHVADAGAEYVVEARYHAAPGTTAPAQAMLLTEVRGYLVYIGQRPLDGPAPATWRLAKARYPNGILHITLVDEKGTPQAERLAFVQNGPAALPATITADRPSYGLRAPVQVRVRVADAAGQPVAAHFSVAVAEGSVGGLDPNAETIASNLLLTSDLAGYVENPGYYFQAPSAATAQALDNLLLTQGWRRFVWKDVLSGQPAAVPFAADKALALSGQVLSEHGYRPIPNSQLTFVETRPVRQVTTGTTDASGRFNFVGFDGRDTAVVTLQARRAQGGSNVVIRTDTGPPLVGPPLPPLPAPPPAIVDYMKRSRQQQADEHEMNPNLHAGMVVRNILLGNVAVTAKRVVVPPNDSRRLYGATGGTLVDFTEIPSAQSGMNILQVLQGRIAGLTVTGNPPNMSVQIRNQGTPIFILDGQKVDLEFISNLTSNDIEAVEVFKGTEAAIFGGSGGAIAIYTKRGDSKYKGADKGPAPGIATVRLPGYYQAREFYAPRYGAPTLTAPGPDPRRTALYWNPDVRTNAAGEAAFTVFTADVNGTFQVVAEGLTPAGQPVRGTATVVVQGNK
ncbi:TonB-dependent receptor plug domain-containing protein [Hymenobacter caeli]|uniref:TonB-dependent receptor plug domain-containing protein n=1 Tax=Hymenobacter caeli TaxID=2735894 RepID=A0ABX2FPH1_9BACT|nr:TonB-dependent receptor plug domain-containing protein [Hymenobacter caeli]NRT18441.1 hypothetical protein [Hymenobacter caeli]